MKRVEPRFAGETGLSICNNKDTSQNKTQEAFIWRDNNPQCEDFKEILTQLASSARFGALRTSDYESQTLLDLVYNEQDYLDPALNSKRSENIFHERRIQVIQRFKDFQRTNLES